MKRIRVIQNMLYSQFFRAYGNLFLEHNVIFCKPQRYVEVIGTLANYRRSKIWDTFVVGDIFFEVILIRQFLSHSTRKRPISMTSKHEKKSLTRKVSYIFDHPVVKCPISLTTLYPNTVLVLIPSYSEYICSFVNNPNSIFLEDD